VNRANAETTRRRSGSVRILPAWPKAVAGIVAVHRAAFRGFFMTSLGPMFLADYYRSVLAYNVGILLVALSDDDTVVGFVAGFGNARVYYEGYHRARLRHAIAALPAVVRSPSLLRRLLLDAYSVSRGRGGGQNEVELASIAATGAANGSGSILLGAFVSEARKRGYRSIYLTTDAISNDRVNAFYVRHGFKLAGALDSAGRKMNEYRLMLSELGACDGGK
jgi:GNAT superfamily N-acetyltransferase